MMLEVLGQGPVLARRIEWCHWLYSNYNCPGELSIISIQILVVALDLIVQRQQLLL